MRGWDERSLTSRRGGHTLSTPPRSPRGAHQVPGGPPPQEQGRGHVQGQRRALPPEGARGRRGGKGQRARRSLTPASLPWKVQSSTSIVSWPSISMAAPPWPAAGWGAHKTGAHEEGERQQPTSFLPLCRGEPESRAGCRRSGMGAALRGPRCRHGSAAGTAQRAGPSMHNGAQAPSAAAHAGNRRSSALHCCDEAAHAVDRCGNNDGAGSGGSTDLRCCP